MNMSKLQEINKKICRLCLKTVVDKVVMITEDISLDISSVLLFLYIDISSSPVMCAECEKSLQNAINFKNSRKMIRDVSLDSEIFQYINKCKSPSELSDSQKVELCHFCLNYPTEHWCSPKIECNVFLSEIFCEIRTELNIPSLEDPVACQKCFYIIQDILRFTRNCLKVEEKIKRFVEAKGAEGQSQINLKKVQMFQSDERNSNNYESEPHYVRRTSPVEVLENFDVKNEYEMDNCEEGYEENIIVKSENEDSVTLTVNYLNDESSFDVDGFTQTPIKNEAVEIKTEEDDPNSFMEQRTVQGKKVLVCKLCGYSSTYKHCILRHFLSHKSKFEVDLCRCPHPQCDFTTKYKSGLARHMITHKDVDEVQIFKCDKCSFQTKHRYGIKKHSIVHKSPSEVTMWKCSTCGREFKRKQQLTKHVMTHKRSELQKYKCYRCDYQSLWKDNVRTHMLTHMDATEVPMYQCHLCSHQTKQKSSLKIHFEVHKKKDRKMYKKCSMCDYKSKYEGHLKRHFKLEHDSGESERTVVSSELDNAA